VQRCHECSSYRDELSITRNPKVGRSSETIPRIVRDTLAARPFLNDACMLNAGNAGKKEKEEEGEEEEEKEKE